MHQSFATIDSPEFINLQPLEINPLMSSCEIKVLYVGENRNHSFISKEVATEMAKTLRGAPIVGYYKEDKEDFADHGERMIFDDEGVKFQCMTKPYGFVSPDAKVWFQKFEDYDDFGNSTVREYLMTTGYLWTGQFEECKSVVDEGKPHSMELDDKTLDGKWSTDTKRDLDIFIINDAMFSKLCILGDDVEPCFEGSSVTSPKVSSSFSLDDDFRKTLHSMMQDLKFALKGGNTMDVENKTTEVEATAPATDFTEAPAVEAPDVPADISFAKDKDDDKKKEKEEEKKDETPAPKDDEKKDAPKDDKGEEDDEDKKKKDPATKHELSDELASKFEDLSNQFSKLQESYSALKAEYDVLAQFKADADLAKKDALINEFAMLPDELKADVIENKAKYSLEEIESKLCVACVRNNVNFNLADSSKNDNKVEDTAKPAATYNLDSTEAIEGNDAPAWVAKLIKMKNDNN